MDSPNYYSSTLLIANKIALTNDTIATVTSVAVSPGVYDVVGQVFFKGGVNVLVSAVAVCVSSDPNADMLDSDTSPGLFSKGQYMADNLLTTVSLATIPTRITMAAAGTLYLLTYCDFTTDTMSAWGFIRALRVA